MFGSEQNKSRQPCGGVTGGEAKTGRGKPSAESRTAAAKIRTTRRRFGLGWAGCGGGTFISTPCRQNHAITPFVGEKIADVSKCIKGGDTATVAHPASGGKSRFCGAGGAQDRARGGELEDGETAETPPDRANRGKSKRKRGAGTGGGGELFCASEGEAFDTAARGTSPARPAKAKKFSTGFAVFLRRCCTFFGVRVP